MVCERLIIPASVAILAISSAMAADDAAVLKQAQKIFQTLPKDMGAPNSPLANERAYLGRLLFFDPRITVDGNVSCATCHQPALYGTDARTTSIGVKGRAHPRNAPTILNSALNPIVHWRGDRESLEDQATKALGSPITSGQPDETAVLDRLGHTPGYATLFKTAFPDEPQPMTLNGIAKAIAAYERTLVTPSPFDAYLNGNTRALSQREREGLAKFITTGCVACHNGAGVGGGMYAKFGVVDDYWTATGSKEVDKGRFDVTQNTADMYVFRVPSLRNVAMTPPYFHDGSVASLPEAVQIMAKVQLGASLSDDDTLDIVAFLGSLTGELPEQFVNAPILPPGVPNFADSHVATPKKQ